MREISTRVPAGVRRMTDGETGERNYWILFKIRASSRDARVRGREQRPGLRHGDGSPGDADRRLAGGTSAGTIKWPDLGYAAAYAESFEVFRDLQAEGTIPEGVRFQMQYPTPLASIAGTIVPEDLPSVAPSYEAALFADLDRALAALPHERCAVQWDVAVEFGMLEGGFDPTVTTSVEELTPGLARAVDHVLPDVPVGLHLCYGDYGHQHFKQPESLAMQVALVNAVVAAASRPVGFVSFTVPQAQGDEVLRPASRPSSRGRDRALLRPGAVSPRRAAAGHDGRAGEGDRRRSGRVAGRRARLGDLHRMRDGPGR